MPIAEDQTMVRGALSALLSLEADIEIVAEASRGDEVVPTALDSLPDVALLDIEMPGGDGSSAAATLKERLPSCRVLILTVYRACMLPQAGYGERSSWLPAQGCPGLRARLSHPLRHGRRADCAARPGRSAERERKTRSPGANARCFSPRRTE